MAEIGAENKVAGVFGGVEINAGNAGENANGAIGGFEGAGMEAGTIRNTALPAKTGLWTKFKAFWLQEIDWNKEIKVELTPYQQKVEDEINEFLHQEITWEKVHDFLFQEVTFGKRK